MGRLELSPHFRPHQFAHSSLLRDAGLLAILREVGYAFAIYPSLSGLIAASAIETAFTKLRDEGDGEPADMPMFDFKEFCKLIGFQEVWDFELKWAK